MYTRIAKLSVDEALKNAKNAREALYQLQDREKDAVYALDDAIAALTKAAVALCTFKK